MTRLLVPRRKSSAGFAPEAADAAPGAQAGDNYLDLVVKYIPTEIVGAYVALENIVEPQDKYWMSLAILVICFLFTPLYLFRRYREGIADGTSTTAQRNQHTLVSTAMFLVWAYAVNGSGFGTLRDPAVASALLVIASLAAGLLEPPPRQ